VGKTALINKYIYDEFPPTSHDPTHQVNFKFEGYNGRLIVADGFTHEDFDKPEKVRQVHDANVVGIVYDVTDFNTFSNLKYKFDKLL
jgi:GTPase SAR1 family protein